MTLTIKEHIEKGHYPKDDKGRALVPMRNGRTAVIYTVSHTASWPIAGAIRNDNYTEGLSLRCWRDSGRIADTECDEDLLPPQPKKVKVVQFVTQRIRDGKVIGAYDIFEEAESDACTVTERIVELTGEYEEDWT